MPFGWKTGTRNATLGSLVHSTVNTLRPKNLLPTAVLNMAGGNKKPKITTTTYEITGLAGSYRDSREFYSDRSMLGSATYSQIEDDIKEAVETPLISPEDFEIEDEEDDDDEFVIVDYLATEDWQWVDHWIKFLVDRY